MTPGTAKRVIPAVGSVLFCLVLAVGAVVVLAGCSGGEKSTTTAVAATTTSMVETSTTSTTEEITTTTTSDFPPTVTHQQDGSRFTYSGKWNTLSASSASGKTFAVANSADSSLTFRFYGVACSWVAKTSPAYGHAEVQVDDGPAQTVDLYSANTAWKKKVWRSGTMEMGDHTVTISWTGDKTDGATAANINVDAIVVAGVLIDVYEEDNAKFAYEGTWKTSKSSATSGGTFMQADSSGASVTVRFTGVRLTWFGRVGESNGRANVSVDGGPEGTVDLYASTTESKQALWDTGILDLETHTVTISWSGEKNASATGTGINVDGFQVTGVLE